MVSCLILAHAMSTYKTRAIAAIAALNERGGSSLSAIKKEMGLGKKQARYIGAALKRS